MKETKRTKIENAGTPVPLQQRVMCDCNGCPVKGVACGYVAVGGKYCKAPLDYKCVYKAIDKINRSISNIDNILGDIKENDPEFHNELKHILNT